MQETSTLQNSTFVCTRNFGIAAVPAVNMFDSYIEPLTLLLLLRIAQTCQSPRVSLPPLLGPWRAEIPLVEIDELHYIFSVKPGDDLALQNTQDHPIFFCCQRLLLNTGSFFFPTPGACSRIFCHLLLCTRRMILLYYFVPAWFWKIPGTDCTAHHLHLRRKWRLPWEWLFAAWVFRSRHIISPLFHGLLHGGILNVLLFWTDRATQIQTHSPLVEFLFSKAWTYLRTVICVHVVSYMFRQLMSVEVVPRTVAGCLGRSGCNDLVTLDRYLCGQCGRHLSGTIVSGRQSTHCISEGCRRWSIFCNVFVPGCLRWLRWLFGPRELMSDAGWMDAWQWCRHGGVHWLAPYS